MWLFSFTPELRHPPLPRSHIGFLHSSTACSYIHGIGTDSPRKKNTCTRGRFLFPRLWMAKPVIWNQSLWHLTSSPRVKEFIRVTTPDTWDKLGIVWFWENLLWSTNESSVHEWANTPLCTHRLTNYKHLNQVYESKRPHCTKYAQNT